MEITTVQVVVSRSTKTAIASQGKAKGAEVKTDSKIMQSNTKIIFV